MPSFNERYHQIVERVGTRLCVGLDTDPANIPGDMSETDNPALVFNRAIVEATRGLCCAYKPNLAFYEADGERGLETLRGTLAAIGSDVIVIGDAKRGDIGNTAERYATALYDDIGFDAVTVNPYLGLDSLEPFFRGPERCVFVLALTSNPGSNDFQRLASDGKPIYMHVIDKCMERYGSSGSLGFVVGATHPGELSEIRRHVGRETPLLIPGLGTQGGDADEAIRANDGGVAFFNVSRGISGAGKGSDYADRAHEAAERFARLLPVEQA